MKPTSPCVSLLLSILATVAGFTTASASETYSADGVNLENILESTRFYDTGKGLYWEVVGQPYDGAKELYNASGNSFSFLGDLQTRVSDPIPQFKDAFDNLVNDGNSCWYCVGANIIQYWESYYGVFYKGDAPLPYGYTYDTANLSTLAGTQSLDLHMFFYDNWTQEDRDGRDAGGDAEMAAVWYLATGKNIQDGKPRYSQLVDGAAEAGFFSEYFTENAASREAYYIGGDATDLISATDFLREAFGLDREGNQATYGQIAYLGILNKRNEGHALTCYGFTTGENGQLESLYLTNSDDKEYKVTRVYVGWDGQGHLHLYEDAAHTKGWMFIDSEWDICDITYINTPALLKEMYDEYTHAALTWTGARSAWTDRDAAEATTEVLPGADSGWQVFALDDYYDSYYHEGRKVAFTDLAAKTKTDVALQGKLATPELRLTNNTTAYTFTGSSGTTLRADDITKQGSADATFRSVAITANTMDVDMGALILGTGATLTAQIGEVDDMGTLQLAGGSAAFTGGLEIFSSGTLAVTAASQLTTTLTLDAGSFLSFTPTAANKTTQLLTLTGNLDVQGSCRLIVDGTSLTSGQSYILAGVSGNITGLDAITTNCGTITLNGKQLVLNYTKPGTLNWSGGSGVWSATQWDGGSAASQSKDLTFSPASGSVDITVTGTVSPNSMRFNHGEIHLVAGQDALVSGCHTITLGNGATIYAAVPLTGGNITMESGSTLYMALNTPTSEITGLEMAPGSTVVFRGSARYMVDKAGALGGHIELHDTTSLVVGSSLDTELYGTFSGDEGAAIVLMNSSEGHPVTFYMGPDTGKFKGSVTIGTDDDAPLTTLRMGSATRNFTITGNGELSLRGRGDITGYMTGTGMLTIEHDATYQLAPGGKVSFGNQIVLNVAGSATAGTATAPLKAALQDKILVSGNLTAYYQAEQGGQPLALKELTLRNGGSYTLVHLERTVDSVHTIDALTVDGGGVLTNSIIDVETESSAPKYKHDITINTLSGTGTLELNTSSDLYVTKTIIGDTAPGGYDGDLLIVNPHYYKMSYYANYDHGQVVEMKSGTVKGAVRLEAHGMMNSKLVYYGLAGFGVGGDITVGGLDDTESSKTTYLYSGSYSAACATKDTSHLFDNNIALEKHTLTINAAEDYEFRGQVFAWLSLVKQGSGTQTFSGDTSEFEGALSVSDGELAFTNAIGKATAVTLNGGTLRLHGGELAGLDGSGGTLALETGEYSIDLTGSTGSYAVQLNGTTAHVTSSGTFGGSITTTGASAITVASSNQLTLQNAIGNGGTLTLAGVFDASALELTVVDDTHVNTEGQYGDSGFSMKGGSFVTIVEGGTTNGAGATIYHSKLKEGTLTLNADGTATTGPISVDYSTYLLTGTDTANVAAINQQAGGALTSIDVEGGTLTVDAATNLIGATGGNMNITANVTVGGSAKDTAISAAAGTLNTELSGTTAITKTGTGTLTINGANTHSGATTVSGGVLKITNKDALGTGAVQLSGGTLNIAANGFGNTVSASGNSAITVGDTYSLSLTNALGNTGNLILKGVFNISALKLSDADITHVDTEGQTGASGFTKTGSRSVTVVSGGTVTDAGSSFIHTGLKSGETLILNTDGKATTSGVVDYTSYLLMGTDTAKVSAITASAGNLLKGIDVQGGTLTVDAATNLIGATGGNMNITANVTVGGSAKDTALSATAGTLNTVLSGTTAITKTGSGTLTVTQANKHSGDTTISGGVLKITNAGALGSGGVKLSGGTLNIAANGFGNTVSASGNSAITVANTYTLTLEQAIQNTGNLTLKGAFDASELELSHNDSTHEDINGNLGANGFTKTGSYSVTIVNDGTTKDGGAAISHSKLQGAAFTLGTDGKATYGGTVDYSTYLLTGEHTTSVSAITNAAGGKLQAINMEGGRLTVDVSTDKLGAISGYAKLDILDNVKLTINRANNVYTGDTCVFNGGVLKVGNAHALGTGTVHLSCGTLEIADGGFSNEISTSCSGSVVSVAQGETLRMQHVITNEGTLTLKGAFDASALELKDEGTRIDTAGHAGDSGFELKGAYSVQIVSGGTTKVEGATITHSGAAGKTFTLGSNGVATTEGTMDYSTYLLAGTDTAMVSTINQAAGGKLKSITMKGGKLTVDADARLSDDSTGGKLVVTQSCKLTPQGKVDSLEMKAEGVSDSNGKLMFADELALSGTLETGTLTLTKGDITGGSIKVSDSTEVKQGYIGSDITGTTLAKTGDKRVELGGKNTFSGGVTVQAGSLALLEDGSMSADITVKNGAALLTAINVAGGITLESGAIMRLRPDKSYTLTNKLTSTTGAQFYGDLVTGSGSTLTLKSTGTEAALTVHGNVTLSSGTAQANGTWGSGTYKLIETVDGGRIDSQGQNLNTYFNLAQESYKLDKTETAITLVKKAASPVLQRMAGSGLIATASGEITLADAPITETLVAGVADALVQADWGTVNAGRAFNGTLNGRHQSLRAICNGRTAVWVNALGSSTRQSSAHGHAGADHNLYGGVIGVEFNAGEHGAAGVALGHTWNRVSTFGMNRVKQDTQHAGAFGRARLASGGANALWLEVAASYGKTDSRGTLGASRERWSQNGCTLNVHANDVWQVNDETAVNVFGGLEYTATDSGRIDALRTGSVQNLRGEIGAGVTRTIGRGMVYAEAALQGDMVRHNPQADTGTRRGGANPGRIGGSISVGGAYIINAHWSLNASYTFEGVKHSNSHNVNAGATFRF